MTRPLSPLRPLGQPGQRALLRLRLALAATACLVLTLAPSLSFAFFGTISVKDEIEMGKQFDNTIRTQMAFVDDPEIVAYVKGVVDRVSTTLPPQPWQIKSSVVAHGAMNAFAIPGGYIYIFTGLILGVENEDELAAVIGHELAHVTERHIAKRIQQMKAISIAPMAGMVAGALLGSGGGGNTPHTRPAAGPWPWAPWPGRSRPSSCTPATTSARPTTWAWITWSRAATTPTPCPAPSN